MILSAKSFCDTWLSGRPSSSQTLRQRVEKISTSSPSGTCSLEILPGLRIPRPHSHNTLDPLSATNWIHSPHRVPSHLKRERDGWAQKCWHCRRARALDLNVLNVKKKEKNKWSADYFRLLYFSLIYSIFCQFIPWPNYFHRLRKP